MERTISEIIEYIVVLELDIKKPYTYDDVENNYKQLSKIYHPDTAIKRYKDGKKFMLLNEARAYLIDNFEYVNKLIINNYNYYDNNDIDYENVKSY
ncbi:MAG: J domain-containing protein, partial [Acholeplasmatales bacterium]|nr:J domain-containing protein [Acholeplasmatales bacterium]